MIRNYLKIAWRNMMKNKIFTIINIIGLAVGLTCCMLISLYIFNELSFDQHHQNGDRIYQLGTVFIDEGKEDRKANTSAPIGRMLQEDFPEIEKSARLMSLWRDDKTLFQVKDDAGNTKSFYETQGYLADSVFFHIMNYQFREGNPETALLAPNSVVLSEEIAQKLFSQQSALGKVIRISSSTNGDHDFKVTGVYKNPAAPTHIDARFFLSFGGGSMYGFANNNPSLAYNNMFFTYLLLKKNANPKNLEAKFPAFVQTHLGEELKSMGKGRNYFITPVDQVHLTGLTNNVTAGGSKTSLFILGTIAILTLLIACINFMNLATSVSAKRAAEVGVRKVLGAQRNSLLKQFLGEAFLMTAVSLLFAFFFMFLLLPLFERVAGKNLPVSFERHAILFLGFILLAAITGLVAGSYPAFYLSSFAPIKVLKGKFSNSLSAVSLRKGLVVFQFVISITLIVASIVIAEQMQYMRSKDLGFTKDQQIILPLRTSAAKGAIGSFKKEVANDLNIRSIGAAMYYPGIKHTQDWLMYRQGKTKNDSKTVYINLVDHNFLETINVQVLAGRLFSEDFPADSLTRFVVNEETIKQFGFSSPEDAIGKYLAFEPNNEQVQFSIIGVVKNFHFKSLHEEIQPIAFRLYDIAPFNYMLAHSGTANVDHALASLETTWKKLNPNEPFEYSFLDLDFQKNYEAESRHAGLINNFTLIAILISCLGLFGLATFTAEQRIKEIGIRKILGAPVNSLVMLLSKDFLKLVFLAVLIASPVAWYFMNKWLQNFQYRTEITWHVFLLTAVLAVVIAFITISFQAVKAASANPIKNLRTE